MLQLCCATRTPHGDYVLRIWLTMEGFKAVPDTILGRERQMMMLVEGRQSHCWNCKQIGHLSKTCPRKKNPDHWHHKKKSHWKKQRSRYQTHLWNMKTLHVPKMAWHKLPEKRKKGTPPKKKQRSYPKLRLPKLRLTNTPANQKNQSTKTLHTPGKLTDRKPQQRTPPSKHLWKHPTICKEETVEKDTLKNSAQIHLLNTTLRKKKMLSTSIPNSNNNPIKNNPNSPTSKKPIHNKSIKSTLLTPQVHLPPLSLSPLFLYQNFFTIHSPKPFIIKEL